MYRVFLGAPTRAELAADPRPYGWQTVSSSSRTAAPAIPQSGAVPHTQSMILPQATLEAASARISRIYQNIIFDDSINDEAPTEDEESESDRRDQTTMITWAPTAADNSNASHFDISNSSFFNISKSHLQTTQFETQETQESQSYNYSDASSIARFPDFHFSLHSLTSITALGKQRFKGTRKINVLLAALEVEGPDTIRIKKGADAGKEVSILKMILGDEDGAVCKLTAWREVAETWGGGGTAIAAKRGDILLIENVMATCDPATSPSLTASPYQKSSMTLCYRTMPYTHEDNRLRPDLRLGESDASVRKVASVVRWFEHMAGLPAAT
ncbi:hypothetical protein BDQ12DRAFT_696667 [Crucibulum laeve]|uniref:Shieldin complex subunit 2 first OB fold domain-containing protein n=1 Tax=Crucibulum laeve TaxID=68775 RepID=A0A5C3MM90_9AGAR|nr:hypothetical protein BDQ12DRAFT_696667 [Crucibulum laeve]